MCESYHLTCQCEKNRAEIFFGKMLLNPNSINTLYCPECSFGHDQPKQHRVLDNGWVLELNMDVIKHFSSTFGITPEHISAEWIFDSGYITWVGITPDDSTTRNKERENIQELAKTDILAYIKAMKEWGIERENRFTEQGWRKMRVK